MNKSVGRNQSRSTFDIFALFLPEIRELLQGKDFSSLKDLLKQIHSMDLAEGFRYLKPQEKVLVFKLLTFKKAREIFEHLSFKEQSYLLGNLESDEVAQILNEMAPDERTELFNDLPPRQIKKFFSLMKEEEVRDVRKQLTYKEGTAGSQMTTEFVELKKEMTARRAIIHLQQGLKAGQTRNIYSVYVTDEIHKLTGAVTLQTLVTAPPDILIRDIITSTDPIKVGVSMDVEEVTKIFTKYDLLDMPVVDSQNRFVGVITVDDVVDIIHREATEDIYGMGKIAGVEEAAQINYAQASIFSLVKRRVVWLFILLLIGAFVSGRLLKGYSNMLQQLIVLAAFLPMLMDSAGNAGQQSLCLIVRGLATGEVNVKEIFKVVRKEIAVGFLMGLLVGTIGYFAAFLLEGFNPALGLTVGISMLIVVTVATLVGATLPLVFKRMGFDPAVAASPFITTLVDATTLIVYFETSRALMF
ncbi:MAG: magnesium transporter [Candidatus Omnitrophota bacterium]|nr:magnesium transporter [Candidatus Omnitrophota bacterium]